MYIYKNCVDISMANLGSQSYLPGIAAATSTRVDSSSKHILQCKNSEHYMMLWLGDDSLKPMQKKRQLHLQRDKYCVFKNDLVMNVNSPMFHRNRVFHMQPKAYPSVVSSLADCHDIYKRYLCHLYSQAAPADFFDVASDPSDGVKNPRRDTPLHEAKQALDEATDQLKTATAENRAERELAVKTETRNYDIAVAVFQAAKWGVAPETVRSWFAQNTSHGEKQVAWLKRQIEDTPFFRAEGYALGTAWASDQTGDTVSSILIGGMQTVMNGAFPCNAGEVLQWYFEFEASQFSHYTTSEKWVGERIIKEDPLIPNLAASLEFTGEQNYNSRNDNDQMSKRRKVFNDRHDGLDETHKGNKFFPKPYRLCRQGHEYVDHYGDKIRIFAKCVSSARSHEMMDIMLLTQTL